MNRYIKMKCENCGAEMDVDPDKKMIYCPYCGAKTLVEESTIVKLSRMARDVKVHEADAEKEKAEAEKYKQMKAAEDAKNSKTTQDNIIIILSLGMVCLCVLLLFVWGLISHAY